MKAKRSKSTGHFVEQTQLLHQMKSAPMAAAVSSQTNNNNFGPCVKISIGDYVLFFFTFKLISGMRLNNNSFSNFV